MKTVVENQRVVKSSTTTAVTISSTKVSSCIYFQIHKQLKHLFSANDMNRMINTHIEASQIGRQIADQVLDYQRRMGDMSSGLKSKYENTERQFFLRSLESSPDPDPTVGIQTSMLSENLMNASMNIDQSLAGTSSMPFQKINGTYGNFTTYNHARSSTVVSPENGE